jgi:hypothetical protein
LEASLGATRGDLYVFGDAAVSVSASSTDLSSPAPQLQEGDGNFERRCTPSALSGDGEREERNGFLGLCEGLRVLLGICQFQGLIDFFQWRSFGQATQADLAKELLGRCQAMPGNRTYRANDAA